MHFPVTKELGCTAGVVKALCRSLLLSDAGEVSQTPFPQWHVARRVRPLRLRKTQGETTVGKEKHVSASIRPGLAWPAFHPSLLNPPKHYNHAPRGPGHPYRRATLIASQPELKKSTHSIKYIAQHSFICVL